MLPVEISFPQFEANQVLTNRHLNQLFRYLDEQSRLTRTNLIGIGIVCGLDVVTASDGLSLTITRGCGITSEGYLVVQEELVAQHAKPYAIPDKVPYPPFSAGGPYDILELTANAGPNTTPLSQDLLTDRIVVLFVELLEESLKNCSPNSCDDKGLEIQTTIRPLLIPKSLADQLQRAKNDQPDLNAGRIALPDIRMPRFDVPATGLTTTADIVKAYRKILSKDFLENTVRPALVDAFNVFQIVLNGLERSILTNWQNIYGPDETILLSQPYEYQYVYDFISDLLETYREIREKGIDTFSVCCPDSQLFPRHLFLKEAAPGVVHNRIYRHYFIPSPIFSHYRERAMELKSLFSRLLAQVSEYELPTPLSLAAFTGSPMSFMVDNRVVKRSTVRITPSRLGDVYLSDKAIPYYYRVTAENPPLYERWNAAKTREGKAKTNYSYHAEQYLDPVPDPASDPFWNPLRFDLERQNFYRIEGHVGILYPIVLRQILSLRATNRLAFDVVTIRTGTLSDMDLQTSRYQGFFQDLEATARLMEACCPNEEWKQRLEEEYQRRIRQINEQLLLKNYVRRHPGIQHKAGVPVGGTFIIVYQGDEDDRPADEVRKGPFRIQGRVVDHGEPLPGVTILLEGSTQGTSTRVDGNFLITVPVLPASLRVASVGFQGRRVWINDPQAFVTISLSTEEEESNNQKLPEGTVIADFYLPYQCCSDGPIVQLTVSEPQPEKLTVSLGEPECGETNRTYRVPLTISGGSGKYFINNLEISDTTFSPLIASGEQSEEQRTFMVTDSAGAEFPVTVPVHDCCTDPCGGAVSRSHYIPWFAKPTKVFNNITTEAAHLTVNDNQTLIDIDIKSAFDNVLGVNGSIDSEHYDDAINKICDELSALAGQAKPGVFRIEFDRDQKVLTIEHPACYSFKLTIEQLSYFDEFQMQQKRNYVYDEKQVIVDNFLVEGQNEPSIKIPRFGVLNRNTCSGMSGGKDCRITLKDISVKTLRQEGKVTITLTPVFSPNVDLPSTSFYWIAAGTFPSFSTNPEPQYLRLSTKIPVCYSDSCHRQRRMLGLLHCY